MLAIKNFENWCQYRYHSDTLFLITYPLSLVIINICEMGRKRLHPDPSQAPKGVPCLGALLAKRNTLLDLTNDDNEAPSVPALADAPLDSEHHNGCQPDSVQALVKRSRSVLSKNSNHMAYFSFHKDINAKSPTKECFLR